VAGAAISCWCELALADASLTAELKTQMPERAPSHFFLGVNKTDFERFSALVQAKAPGSELAKQQKPSAERAGHAGRQDSGTRHQRVAELVEPRDRRRRRGDTLPAERQRLASLGRPEDRRHLPARPVQVRLDDLEHEPGRDRRVERVPTPLQRGTHGHQSR